MADKKQDILEFFEQSNFEQFTPTRRKLLIEGSIKSFLLNHKKVFLIIKTVCSRQANA
jgi:hypothetical protein